MSNDLIAALASGPGRGAVAVFRLSGSGTASVLQRLVGELPVPRRSSLRQLRDRQGVLLDQAVILWLPGPASYTGEDSAEIHAHGGLAVKNAIFNALVALGARPAAPGEFTKRAFLAGKLDLLQAEAVADLVDAETEGQRRQALRQLKGELGSVYRGWMSRLRALLATEEALIDFPDDDLPAGLEAASAHEISELIAAVDAHMKDGRRGERLHDGLFIAVVGQPNVGKSSVVNRLAGRDVSIVTPLAGTTRDAIEVKLDLEGVAATLVDTAGMRETEDVIEREGVARARRRAGEADIVLEVRTSDHEGVRPPSGGSVLLVQNKIDLQPAGPGCLGISCVTGEGFDALRAALVSEAIRLAGEAEAPTLTRARHRKALEKTLLSLRAASAASAPELRGEELRLAVRALGEITGVVAIDALLDDLFARFCIGK